MRLVTRLGHLDVRQHIRATFIPLILQRITHKEKRLKESEPISICTWKPFQATYSERRPAKKSRKTPFNLVPCSNHLEVAFASFADLASDVIAFAKNAGPQALRIDYLTGEGRKAIYTPDFFVRKPDGNYLLVETKGRADRDVPFKARAAVEWCKSASKQRTKWEYLYIPQDVFAQVSGNSIEELARACAPSLAGLVKEAKEPQLILSFEKPDEERVAEQTKAFLTADELSNLPTRYRKAIEHAVSLFHFHEKKKEASFAPVFQPLLGPIDHAAETVLVNGLMADVPGCETEQKDFFEPDMSSVKTKSVSFLQERARSLKRLLVHRSPLMPTGLLIFCLDYGKKDTTPLPGIFTSVRSRFAAFKDSNLQELLQHVYDFRNDYVAHEKKKLTDVAVAREALKTWTESLPRLHSVKIS